MADSSREERSMERETGDERGGNSSLIVLLSSSLLSDQLELFQVKRERKTDTKCSVSLVSVKETASDS